MLIESVLEQCQDCQNVKSLEGILGCLCLSHELSCHNIWALAPLDVNQLFIGELGHQKTSCMVDVLACVENLLDFG